MAGAHRVSAWVLFCSPALANEADIFKTMVAGWQVAYVIEVSAKLVPRTGRAPPPNIHMAPVVGSAPAQCDHSIKGSKLTIVYFFQMLRARRLWNIREALGDVASSTVPEHMITDAAHL